MPYERGAFWDDCMHFKEAITDTRLEKSREDRASRQEHSREQGAGKKKSRKERAEKEGKTRHKQLVQR